MSARAYDQIVAGLVDVLRNDPRLEDVPHVTDEVDDPTDSQCPALQVDMKSFSRDPKRLTAMLRSASPYDEDIELTIKVWVFDAQGAASARRRREDLVRRVMDVVADHPTFNDTVDYGGVHRGDFDVIPSRGGGVFARADLSVRVWAQS